MFQFKKDFFKANENSLKLNDIKCTELKRHNSRFTFPLKLLMLEESVCIIIILV